MIRFFPSLIAFVVMCGAVMETSAVASGGLAGLRRSVYKITVVSQYPDFAQPWRLIPSGTSSGSGFYIGDGRILTNAHVIANATFITVQRDGDQLPVPARVLHVAHDSDLALLTVADPAMFRDVAPLRFGSMPRLRSPVSTIGYPTGGDQISITEGVVSRVGYHRYVHDGVKEHLLVQVDSAINPGNSGGPVVQGRLVVGVAFQAFTAAENTGYIIPTPVVRRFLIDVDDGRYDGHPDDGLSWMRWSLVNAATAKFHGFSDGKADRGVKITAVAPYAPTAGLLLPGDVIVAVDGQNVGVDGKVVFENERVDFPALFDLRQMGELVTFRVLREQKEVDVLVRVAPNRPSYVRGDVYAARPRYTVYAGLVFTALSRSYLRSFGREWQRRAPILLRWMDHFAGLLPVSKDMSEIVVLSARLPDAVNTWARDLTGSVVDSVDGVSVTSVRQLHELLVAPGSEHQVLRFQGEDTVLVLDRGRAQAASPEILGRFGVDPPFWFAGPEVDGAIQSISADPDTARGDE